LQQVATFGERVTLFHARSRSRQRALRACEHRVGADRERAHHLANCARLYAAHTGGVPAGKHHGAAVAEGVQPAGVPDLLEVSGHRSGAQAGQCVEELTVPPVYWIIYPLCWKTPPSTSTPASPTKCATCAPSA